MAAELTDLADFVAVARAGGFREAARAGGRSASGLSEAVGRLERRAGRAVAAPDDAERGADGGGGAAAGPAGPGAGRGGGGAGCGERVPRPPGRTLRLNVPVSAARLVLPAIVPGFLAAYPEIMLDVVAEDGFVDVLAAGCDAGVRYDERLEQDMIAIPIGPRRQRFATAAAPAYLDRCGRPAHPRDLLGHACLRGRFASGAMNAWEFERDGEVVTVEPGGPLIVRVGEATDLAVQAAVAGCGVIHLFEEWLRPHLDSGALEPVLEPWWQVFSGPFLYYSGRRYLPAPLRAFIDYIGAHRLP